MYYSTYRRVSVLAYILLMGTLCLWLTLAIGVGVGVLFIVLLSLLGLISFKIHFALTEARLDDYGGRIPVPNIGLGMWGVDIIDDSPVGQNWSGDPGGRVGGVGGQGASERSSRCPFCDNPLARPGAQYCDECGRPLSGMLTGRSSGN